MDGGLMPLFVPFSFMCDVFGQCSNLDVRDFVWLLFTGTAMLIVACALAYYLVRRART